MTLHNYMDFTNLLDYMTIEYEVTQDGEVVQSGAVETPDLAPHAEAALAVPFTTPETGVCCLNLYYRLKDEDEFREAGHLLGFDQFVLREEKAAFTPGESRSVSVRETERSYTVEGETFRYVFNRLTGTFDSLVNEQISFLEKPMEWNIWRAPTDNDRNIRREWERAGYDRSAPKVYETSAEVTDDGVVLTAKLSLAAIYLQPCMKLTAVWTIRPDGRIAASVHGDRADEFPFLPRFGLRLFLPRAFDAVEYFGYGPFESYVDKRRASMLGKYTAAVADLHEDLRRLPRGRRRLLLLQRLRVHRGGAHRESAQL